MECDLCWRYHIEIHWIGRTTLLTGARNETVWTIVIFGSGKATETSGEEVEIEIDGN